MTTNKTGDAKTWLRYTRFSIRELFLITMIAAFAIGWLVDRYRLYATSRDLQYWKDCAGAMEFVFHKGGWNLVVKHRRLYVTRIANDPDISVYYAELGEHSPNSLNPLP